MAEKKERPLRLSRDAVLMMTAAIFSLRSTCRIGNGAVLAREGRVISTGYNGVAPGQPHCVDVGCDLDENGHCRRAIHAEVNTVCLAARHGISTEGTTLYCTSHPCPNCSRLLVNSGVKRVVYSKQYPDMSGKDILEKSGIEVSQFDSRELEGTVPAE